MGNTNASPETFTSTASKYIAGLAASVAATVAINLLPAPAMAEAPAAARHVAYADLDVSTAAGAKALLRRIEVAAVQACGGEPSHSPLTPRAPSQFKVCVDESVDTAVTQFGAPLLAELRFGKTGGATLAAR